jgi:phosphoenolpyruvate carboxykinase (ATP)
MQTKLDSKAVKDLTSYGINSNNIHWNLSSEELVDICLKQNLGKLTNTGALAVNTGKFTGRSPKDRFIVEDDVSKNRVWWDGNINQPFDEEKFNKLYDKVVAYLSEKELYVRDAFAVADKRYQANIRVVTELPWVSLFAYNMFISPTNNELNSFSPEWTVLQAPFFKANPEIDGTRKENFTILSFKRKVVLIGGSGYTGEVKKGIFSALNFTLPVFNNVFPMHCSANEGEKGDTAIFFGLSGTGKTTLSADKNRKLIGDDEHGWTSDNKIFNIEGGCYAKVIDLSQEKEPEIFGAIKKGALLENVIFKKDSNIVDFEDVTITQNTRVSYPIDFIENIKVPSIGENPKNIFFLTADAFGVLPPISKLTPAQAAFHFISGYTAKVAGTEEGVNEPQPSFSACFGAPFMPLHPTKYAEMLSNKMKETNVNVWLVNTGWTGGPYGVGSRMKLKYTRSMINAALDGKLDNVDYIEHSIFKLAMPTSCENVPSKVLNPIGTWSDKDAYTEKAKVLALAFHKNFDKFKELANEEIQSGAPVNS